MELRDSELSGGSVKVEVVRQASSQQLVQDVQVRQLTDDSGDVFTLRITVTRHAC